MLARRLAALATTLVAFAACGRSETAIDFQHTAGPQAAHPALLYGTVTTVDGDTYRGRLRFGGDEEAFWGDYFDGRKDTNPWIGYLPEDQRPRRGIRLIGITIGGDGAALQRPFMARMGDIAKLEARGRHLWVTMKSGTVHHLDRYAADDFADGLMVWDATHGVVALSERRISTIEFGEPADPATEPTPARLHATIRTAQGEFTGFVQWGRSGALAADALNGRTAEGEEVSVPFGRVRSITRVSDESGRIALLDGEELVLSDSRQIGVGNRGIYVDDARYGRVLVSWSALERADFTPADQLPADVGPSYGDFPAGRPLTGFVTTRTGERHSGRIVFDLDESEVTETLDAPAHGVDYTLPFELVASIALRGGAEVLLRTGERLQLERAGDLGPGNGGLLIFAGNEAEYVPWHDVERIEFGIRPDG